MSALPTNMMGMSRKPKPPKQRFYLGCAEIARYDYHVVATDEATAWRELRAAAIHHLGSDWLRDNHCTPLDWGGAATYLDYVGAYVWEITLNEFVKP